MKKIILFFTLVFLYSCSTEKNSTPLELKVIIMKSDGTPLTNSHVSVKLYNTSENSNSTVITIGTTDENGLIDLTFSYPSNPSKVISLTFYNDDTEYVQKKIMNIKSTDFENNILELSPITLYKNNELVNLSLNFNKQNASSTIISFFCEGSAFRPIEDYLYFCGTISFDTNFTLNYKVAKNQTFQVNYTVYDEATNFHTDYNIPIPIATTDVVQNVNF